MTWSWKEGVYRSWFIRGTRRFRIIFGTISDTLTETFIFFFFFYRMILWDRITLNLENDSVFFIEEQNLPFPNFWGRFSSSSARGRDYWRRNWKKYWNVRLFMIKVSFLQKKKKEKKMVTHVVSPSIQLLCFLRFTRTSSSAPGASPSTPKIHVLRDTFHRNRVQAPVGCAPSIRPFINVETMK